METILEEIERALAAELWYAAIVMALTLPDICASLEAVPNARPDGQRARYQSWVRRYGTYHLGVGDEDCWSLRCGVVHEGKYANGGMGNIWCYQLKSSAMK
jgi:hypothetical protein